LIHSLFLPKKESRLVVSEASAAPTADAATGTILSLKEGYGFIKSDAAPDNLFFFHDEVLDRDFNDLNVGDPVTFTIETNEKGWVAKQITVG
jgi:cold shock CspA family protein